MSVRINIKMCQFEFDEQFDNYKHELMVGDCAITKSVSMIMMDTASPAFTLSDDTAL